MNNKLGQFIRDKRKDQYVTLRKLAQISGISFSHLSKIERGEHMPSKETIEVIANSLNLDKYELFLLAGHSTDSDMEFWEEIFANLNDDWEIDRNEFLDKNGNPDILKFRNAMVHGNFNSQIYGKLRSYFFPELLTRRLMEGVEKYSPTLTEIYEDQTIDLESSEWTEFLDEVYNRGYEPKQLMKIIDAYEEMEKKIIDIRKEFVD